MKEKAFAQAIHEKFKDVNKGACKLLKDFDTGAIHDFRIEVKKLRAFLGLIGYHYQSVITPTLTKKIKNFYGYVGIIRNLQLQQQLVIDYCTMNSNSVPEEYLAKLKREEIYWKKQALDCMSNDTNFNEDEEMMVGNLPYQANEQAIKRYVADKLYELETLLAATYKEIKIHQVRKLLKNLLFNWHFFPVNALPAALDKKEIIYVVQTLACFRDKCIAINHLQEEIQYQSTVARELEILEAIATQLQVEKEQVRLQVIEMLHKLKTKMQAPGRSMKRECAL
ncbi:CHAD domain-containing protein [Aridibaculum aurantiacum]|uniref:CHAD domain-containing protein n=1 Tax=Aridibaculum aurantiacum TaxID=2810307 RepID=UPI001A96B99F|nr:CHAD domain-containing protein [Aridibaculum aurantiacum]